MQASPRRTPALLPLPDRERQARLLWIVLGVVAISLALWGLVGCAARALFG